MGGGGHDVCLLSLSITAFFRDSVWPGVGVGWRQTINHLLRVCVRVSVCRTIPPNRNN
ncbi:hypothetical protein J6590_101333 [Homalodisca vitripennis]|nr:hypothetical protein J6590_101333 [Homalodisca vitripennis]